MRHGGFPVRRAAQLQRIMDVTRNPVHPGPLWVTLIQRPTYGVGGERKGGKERREEKVPVGNVTKKTPLARIVTLASHPENI